MEPSRYRWRESKLFSDRERVALRNHFSDYEITALTAWIAFQNMGAKFNTARGAEEHGFCALPRCVGAP